MCGRCEEGLAYLFILLTLYVADILRTSDLEVLHHSPKENNQPVVVHCATDPGRVTDGPFARLEDKPQTPDLTIVNTATTQSQLVINGALKEHSHCSRKSHRHHLRQATNFLNPVSGKLTLLTHRMNTYQDLPKCEVKILANINCHTFEIV